MIAASKSTTTRSNDRSRGIKLNRKNVLFAGSDGGAVGGRRLPDRDLPMPSAA